MKKHRRDPSVIALVLTWGDTGPIYRAASFRGMHHPFGVTRSRSRLVASVSSRTERVRPKIHPDCRARSCPARFRFVEMKTGQGPRRPFRSSVMIFRMVTGPADTGIPAARLSCMSSSTARTGDYQMTSRPAFFKGRFLARLAIVGAVAISAPLAVAGTATAASGSVWDRLAQCESGGRWNINTGNGYYGGLQFSPRTWRAFGGTGSASNASRARQIAVAERVLAVQGWGAWPSCSRKIGVRGR